MRWRIGAGCAALMMATAVLTGCAGNGTTGDEVASANNGTASGAASASPSLSPHERELRFAKCMRENGIQMEDPQEGEGIRVELKPGQEETMRKAQEACRQYAPGANGARPDPQMLEKARQFAKCMRDNGVADFADPDPNQPGIRINRKQAEDPDFQRAQEKCQSILGGKGGPGGAPGGGK
jgi:hypothetical protein